MTTVGIFQTEKNDKIFENGENFNNRRNKAKQEQQERGII